MKIRPLTVIALILNFTACANNASTGYNPGNTGYNPITIAAGNCAEAADAATTPGEANYEYFKRCMKQYGYNLYTHPENRPNTSSHVYSDDDASAPSCL
jgi:hypothetical protein